HLPVPGRRYNDRRQRARRAVLLAARVDVSTQLAVREALAGGSYRRPASRLGGRVGASGAGAVTPVASPRARGGRRTIAVGRQDRRSRPRKRRRIVDRPTSGARSPLVCV